MSSTPRGQLTKRPNPSQDLSISNKRQKRPSSVYKQVILDVGSALRLFGRFPC